MNCTIDGKYYTNGKLAVALLYVLTQAHSAPSGSTYPVIYTPQSVLLLETHGHSTQQKIRPILLASFKE